MRAVHLDLLGARPQWLQWGWALLALGAIAALACAWRFYDLQTQQQALQAALSEGRQLSRRELTRAGRSVPDQGTGVDEVVAALSRPWHAIFGELENVADQNVALLAIQPEAAGRRVRLAGEARRYDDMLAYVSRLEGTPGFANVVLSTHQLRDSGGVGFELDAEWVGR